MSLPGELSIQLVLGAAVLAIAAVVGFGAVRAMRVIVLRSREQALLAPYATETAAPLDLGLGRALERAGRLEEVTLLMCDMRGFTSFSEKLSPAETVRLVNAYLDTVCPAITDAGGVIDKFMGDSVLAFFEGGGHASRAVGAAKQMVAAMDRAKLPTTEKVRIGVALHSGDVLVGTIGPRTRREYTVISDAVNTLSRLEKMNKEYASQIIASATTMAEVPAELRQGFSEPLDVPIRGRDATVTVHVYGVTS